MTKVAVVGLGQVGSAVAYASIARNLDADYALLDLDQGLVTAQALDLGQAAPFVHSAVIEASTDATVCADADIVVVASGANQRPGQTRLDLLGANLRMIDSVIPAVHAVAPHATFIIVTNPCDVLVRATVQHGVPHHRAISTGTMLDSARLVTEIARTLQISPHDVSAMVIGEHGDSQVAVWSTATAAIDGEIVDLGPTGSVFTDDDRLRIETVARSSAYTIIEGKGATNYAIGIVTAQLIEDLLSDAPIVRPVSSVQRGAYGLHDVALSLPSIVGRRGIESVLEPTLQSSELAGLAASAEKLRESATAAGR